MHACKRSVEASHLLLHASSSPLGLVALMHHKRTLKCNLSQESFEAAARPPVHQTDPNLTPLEVLPCKHFRPSIFSRIPTGLPIL